MAPAECVLSQHNDSVLWLTLNQPERRNPLSSMMIADLSRRLDNAYDDDSVRVIVITGSGTAFSAGHDLTEVERREGESQNDWEQRIAALLDACAEMMANIAGAPKPVIACVQGIASAAGCQLVSACDLAIAAHEATFCTPGVNIGAFCTTPLVGIGRNLSRKHALEMALTGDVFDASDAQRFGLINHAVSSDQLVAETLALAQKIATKSAESIARGKATFYRQVELTLQDALDLANQVMLESLTAGGDATEGVRAFLEKRKADWQ